MRDNPNITLGDVVHAGYCLNGVRRWCKENGIEYGHFARNGLTLEEVAGIEDVILEIVKKRREERLNG